MEFVFSPQIVCNGVNTTVCVSGSWLCDRQPVQGVSWPIHAEKGCVSFSVIVNRIFWGFEL